MERAIEIRRPRRLGETGWAAVLSFGAAIAHAILVPRTFGEWWQAGVFFVLLTLVEIGVGVLMTLNRWLVPTAWIGIVVNVGTVVTYLISRIWGFDFAPDRGPHGTAVALGRPVLPYTVEFVGPFDYFVLVLEVATIVLLVGLLPPTWRARASTSIAAIGVGVMIAASTLRR